MILARCDCVGPKHLDLDVCGVPCVSALHMDLPISQVVSEGSDTLTALVIFMLPFLLLALCGGAYLMFIRVRLPLPVVCRRYEMVYQFIYSCLLV